MFARLITVTSGMEYTVTVYGKSADVIIALISHVASTAVSKWTFLPIFYLSEYQTDPKIAELSAKAAVDPTSYYRKGLAVFELTGSESLVRMQEYMKSTQAKL